MTQRTRALMAFVALGATMLTAMPASAEFYKDKTLTLLVNYGAGGNADTEARVYQHYLSKYIPGHPSIIVQNAPGAGGVNAINLLGLGIGAKPDGYTMSYFTISATDLIIHNPGLKVPVVDFQIVAGARGWNIAYGRKDIQPGMTKPSDIGKAKSIFAGGYSKTSSHDTRLRLSLEVLGVPYKMVTGFPSTGAINKAMVQGELNFSGSSLPGYQTQVIPQIIKPGIGMPFWQYPVKGKDGQPVGNPDLLKAGIPIFDDVYKQAFGKAPSGPKYEALLMMNDIGTKLQRGMLFNKDVPKEAVEIMRKAVEDLSHDPDFRADYKRVTGQEPDIVGAAELEPLFERVRKLDPKIRQTLQDSVDK